MKRCSVEGCERKADSRGWCKAHYNRWVRNGDPGDADLARAPRVPNHGSVTEYDVHGCRCDLCKSAKAERTRAVRDSLRNSSKFQHGTRRGYSVCSCRCEDCIAAYAKWASKPEVKERRSELDRSRRSSKRANDRAMVGDAPRSTAREIWSGAHLDIVVKRTDLSIYELARMLGRTPQAVELARWRCAHDPKWMKAAGVDDA